ncbi:MAG: hypothetical protein A2138_27190 [Deltaproteobacteria bacterium RBG_16_71_12]|nr:MAG: hypothetical protein A2138_27190 [Deltaproteobacteria bacterium RBG_16_71_12]
MNAEELLRRHLIALAADLERLRRAMAELRAEIAVLLKLPSVGTATTLTETRAERPRDATRPSIIIDDE